jgi:hypothetical protein
MKKSSLYSVGSMVDGVLSRHGIGKQVLSASVVTTAERTLSSLLAPQIKEDVRALSFRENTLTLACRHSAALYDAEGFAAKLGRSLEESFPSLSIKVEAKLRPDAFPEEEAHDIV